MSIKVISGAWNACLHARGDESLDRVALMKAAVLAGCNLSKQDIRAYKPGQDRFTLADLTTYIHDHHQQQQKQQDQLVEAINTIKKGMSIEGGEVDGATLKKILQEHGERMTDAEIQQLFDTLDLTTSMHTIKFNEIVEQVAGTTALCLKSLTSTISSDTDPSPWFTKRLGGWYLLSQDKPLCAQYHFTLSEKSSIAIAVDNTAIDTTLVVIKDAGDDDSASVDIVGVSETVVDGTASLTLEDLAPGAYIILPLTTGVMLKPRAAQPKLRKLADTSKNEPELSKPVVEVLREVFARYNVSQSQSLSRAEYNLLLMCTDGELIDDDTWEYIAENFESKNGGITIKGFLDLYTQALRGTEGGDSGFYTTYIQPLGYDQQLNPDHVRSFTVSVATPRNAVLTEFSAVPHKAHLIDATWLQVIRENGHQEHLTSRLHCIIDRDHVRSSCAIVNEGTTTEMVKVDVTSSRGTVHILMGDEDGSGVATVEVDEGVAVVVCHVVATTSDDVASKKKLRIVTTLVHS